MVGIHWGREKIEKKGTFGVLLTTKVAGQIKKWLQEDEH